MGSVMSYINCPRCKSKESCFEDFYYKTGEVYVNCPECGYSLIHHFKRGEDGKLLKKDESKGFEFDNLIEETIEIKNPYGAYRVESVNGGATCGTLIKKADYTELAKNMKLELQKENNDIKGVFVSRLVKGKIKKETLYQKPE